MSVAPIPKGFHTLTPHIVVNDAKAAAEFYHRAFGAEVMGLSFAADGRVMHAQVRIGDSILMFADEYPEWNSPAPSTTKADTCVRLHLYVDDVDNIGRLIEKQIHPIPHIRETHTILTFEAFRNP